MPPAFPGPAYRIQTQRLVIRCYHPADAPLLIAAIDESVDHLTPWMPWAEGGALPLQDQIDLLRSFRGKFDLGQDFIYGVFNREETKIVGGTGLHTRLGPNGREIGYWVHKDYINQGLATEVSAALTKVAFEVDGMHRVEIHCDPANVRSAAVPRKLGYHHDATLRKTEPMKDGSYRDTMVWSLLREEYPTSSSAGTQIEAFDVIGRKIL